MNNRSILRLFFLFGIVIWLSGYKPGSLSVSNAWARPAATGANSAIYLNLQNATRGDEALLSVSTKVATSAELHLSQDESGVMTMHHQEFIPIPAGETVSLAPGGLHIMLVGLTKDLKAGDTFTVTLLFKNAGKIDIEVSVQEQ